MTEVITESLPADVQVSVMGNSFGYLSSVYGSGIALGLIQLEWSATQAV